MWNARIDFAASAGEHSLSLQQQGGRIQGIYRGEFVARDLAGTIDGETMSGELDMGEYLTARWAAPLRARGARPRVA